MHMPAYALMLQYTNKIYGIQILVWAPGDGDRVHYGLQHGSVLNLIIEGK